VKAKPTAATVSSPTIKLVLVRDGVSVYHAAYVIHLLQMPGATFRSVADQLGIAPSALHRFIGQSGYRFSGRSNQFERTPE
jgi:hypothetical protein